MFLHFSICFHIFYMFHICVSHVFTFSQLLFCSYFTCFGICSISHIVFVPISHVFGNHVNFDFGPDVNSTLDTRAPGTVMERNKNQIGVGFEFELSLQNSIVDPTH